MIEFSAEQFSIESLCQLAVGDEKAQLSQSPEFKDQIDSSYNFLQTLLKTGKEIYGVNTGYGDSCVRKVSEHNVKNLPLQLTRYHQCGLGEYFSFEQARAIQVARVVSLKQGKSAVRYELLNFMVDQLNKGIAPLIPQEGSVGASGDLTPLAYLAATLVGEGHVMYQGEVYPTSELYKKLEITPLELQPKEGLALMNGTAVMTALACLAYEKADYLARLASRITSLASLALKGNAYHFAEGLFEAKPHQGQSLIAQRIRQDLQSKSSRQEQDKRIQDRYSIRCAPHIIGVLQDFLPFAKNTITTELNSANDNPLIDPKREQVLHGGNFYGGHIGFVMDSLKNLIANVADLIDRQVALLVDTKFNNGLPSNLSFLKDKEDISINHGFKALQISISAWTAEALKNTIPVSIFSRSTECHNQDKVSMGTISARDCLNVIRLTEQCAVAGLMISYQGVRLRAHQSELEMKDLSQDVLSFMESFSKEFTLLSEDRPLEPDLRNLLTLVNEQKWSLYPNN